jgi:hypothetical protein
MITKSRQRNKQTVVETIRNHSLIKTVHMLLYYCLWWKLDLYTTNQEIYTRYNTNVHLPMANLNAFQGGVYCFGIKLFNTLPININNLPKETKIFKPVLKIFFFYIQWKCIIIKIIYRILSYYNPGNCFVIFIYYSYSCTTLFQLIYCTDNTNVSLKSIYGYTIYDTSVL